MSFKSLNSLLYTTNCIVILVVNLDETMYQGSEGLLVKPNKRVRLVEIFIGHWGCLEKVRINNDIVEIYVRLMDGY